MDNQDQMLGMGAGFAVGAGLDALSGGALTPFLPMFGQAGGAIGSMFDASKKKVPNIPYDDPRQANWLGQLTSQRDAIQRGIDPSTRFYSNAIKQNTSNTMNTIGKTVGGNPALAMEGINKAGYNANLNYLQLAQENYQLEQTFNSHIQSLIDTMANRNLGIDVGNKGQALIDKAKSEQYGNQYLSQLFTQAPKAISKFIENPSTTPSSNYSNFNITQGGDQSVPNFDWSSMGATQMPATQSMFSTMPSYMGAI